MPDPKLDWFTHDRLGLFVHWGLYALGARHEWLMNRERIQTKTYERYARYFEPDLFDPVDWAWQAKRAGMKYVVLTTKHHEGFCLWDSKLADYTVMNTPYGKDIVAQYVERGAETAGDGDFLLRFRVEAVGDRYGVIAAVALAEVARRSDEVMTAAVCRQEGAAAAVAAVEDTGQVHA